VVSARTAASEILELIQGIPVWFVTSFRARHYPIDFIVQTSSSLGGDEANLRPSTMSQRTIVACVLRLNPDRSSASEVEQFGA
jgi:hypothetical protein